MNAKPPPPAPQPSPLVGGVPQLDDATYRDIYRASRAKRSIVLEAVTWWVLGVAAIAGTAWLLMRIRHVEELKLRATIATVADCELKERRVGAAGQRNEYNRWNRRYDCNGVVVYVWLPENVK